MDSTGSHISIFTIDVDAKAWEHERYLVITIKKIDMSFQSQVHDSFSAVKSSEELWGKLHQLLEEYGISAVFYAVTHVPLALKVDGSKDLFYFKTSYPEEYLDISNDSYSIDDDLSAAHCLQHTTPFIWYNESVWLSPQERLERSTSDAYWYKNPLRVGTTIPLRFSNYGIGGMGLYAGKVTGPEFDDIWGKRKDEVLTIVYMFDEIARSGFGEIFGIKLTEREKDIITLLSDGHPAKVIAAKLGTKTNTVQNQIITARKKLHASNNVQLVAKALTLELL